MNQQIFTTKKRHIEYENKYKFRFILKFIHDVSINQLQLPNFGHYFCFQLTKFDKELFLIASIQLRQKYHQAIFSYLLGICIE